MSGTPRFDPSDGLAFAVRLLNSWDELEPEPELLRGPDIAERFDADWKSIVNPAAVRECWPAD